MIRSEATTRTTAVISHHGRIIEIMTGLHRQPSRKTQKETTRIKA